MFFTKLFYIIIYKIIYKIIIVVINNFHRYHIDAAIRDIKIQMENLKNSEKILIMNSQERFPLRYGRS